MFNSSVFLCSLYPLIHCMSPGEPICCNVFPGADVNMGGQEIPFAGVLEPVMLHYTSYYIRDGLRDGAGLILQKQIISCDQVLLLNPDTEQGVKLSLYMST